MDVDKARRVAEALGWSVFPSKLAQDDVCITINGVGHVWVHDAVIDRIAALLDERDEAKAEVERLRKQLEAQP